MAEQEQLPGFNSRRHFPQNQITDTHTSNSGIMSTRNQTQNTCRILSSVVGNTNGVTNACKRKRIRDVSSPNATEDYDAGGSPSSVPSSNKKRTSPSLPVDSSPAYEHTIIVKSRSSAEKYSSSSLRKIPALASDIETFDARENRFKHEDETDSNRRVYTLNYQDPQYNFDSGKKRTASSQFNNCNALYEQPINTRLGASLSHGTKRVNEAEMKSKLEQIAFSVVSPSSSCLSDLPDDECLGSKDFPSRDESDSQLIYNTPSSPASASASLTDLPEELVLKIVSFIGPRCSSLVHLCNVNRTFHKLLISLGDALLDSARTHRSFRMLLPKLHPTESSLCHFMRHTRCSHDIMMKSAQLRRILDKDFIVPCRFGPIVVRNRNESVSLDPSNPHMNISHIHINHSSGAAASEADDASASIINSAIRSRNVSAILRASPMSMHHMNRNNKPHTQPYAHPDAQNRASASTPTSSTMNYLPTPITMEDIDEALEIALQLICQDSLSYFLNVHTYPPSKSRHITFLDVDRKLLASEDRKCILQHCAASLEHHVLSLAGQAGGKIYKYMKMRHIVLTNQCNYLTLHENNMNKDDVKRLDRARLIMECVICRDLELVRQEEEEEQDDIQDDFEEEEAERAHEEHNDVLNSTGDGNQRENIADDFVQNNENMEHQEGNGERDRDTNRPRNRSDSRAGFSMRLLQGTVVEPLPIVG